MPEAGPGLAASIVGFLESLPVTDGMRDQARLAVLDTIGVALAGGGEPTPAAVRSLQRPGAESDPLRWWDRAPAAVPDAVLTNAVAAHALDYDCLIPAAFVQPGAVLIPGLIALAEQHDLSGRQLADGVARAVALLGALGRAVGNQLHTAGWHPTCLLGIIAGAAAGACLTGQPPENVAAAVGIAVSLASGLKQNFGSMSKELQVGHAARGAVEAASLAAKGITANPRAADSWLALVTATAPGATALNLTPAGSDVHVKRYPCCGRMHAALDAGAELRRRGRLAPGDISGVTCHLNPADIAHIDRRIVRTPAEAKFSAQYALARMLTRGQVGLSDFDLPELGAADVARVMPHVAIRPDASIPSFGAEVAVELADGQSDKERADRPRPATAGDVAAKFTSCCVTAGLDEASALKFARLVGELDELPAVRPLTRSLPVP